MNIEENNEITVRINCEVEEFSNKLEEKGFKLINKFTLDDRFLILKDTNLKNENTRDILSKAVIIRDITGRLKKFHSQKITFKNKKIDDLGNIIAQSAINCEITNIEDAIAIFNAIGYYQVMRIIEDDMDYEKDGFKIAIKNIRMGPNLIEIETNEEYETIDKIKNKLKELDLPVDESDYFVKKAEIELDKIKKLDIN